MALAAVSLAACQKEKTPETVSRNITIKARTIYAPTKAGIGDDSRAQWSIGETAALVSLSDYSVHESAALTSEDKRMKEVRLRFLSAESLTATIGSCRPKSRFRKQA